MNFFPFARRPSSFNIKGKVTWIDFFSFSSVLHPSSFVLRLSSFIIEKKGWMNMISFISVALRRTPFVFREEKEQAQAGN